MTFAVGVSPVEELTNLLRYHHGLRPHEPLPQASAELVRRAEALSTRLPEAYLRYAVRTALARAKLGHDLVGALWNEIERLEQAVERLDLDRELARAGFRLAHVHWVQRDLEEGRRWRPATLDEVREALGERAVEHVVREIERITDAVGAERAPTLWREE